MLLKSYLFFIFTFIITSLYADEFDHIRINEILANNTHIYIDPESKNFEDVIEIYNVGETMVKINGL